MSWKNELEWKDNQESQFVLFKEDLFQIKEGHVSGILIQNVHHEEEHYSKEELTANFKYISFLSEYIGELPVDKTVTFPWTYGKEEDFEKKYYNYYNGKILKMDKYIY